MRCLNTPGIIKDRNGRLCIRGVVHSQISEPLGYIYMVGFDDYVKIGYTSRKVRIRQSSLQTSCPKPLSTLAIARGSKNDEKLLHIMFQYLRTHPSRVEWFYIRDSLAQIIVKDNPARSSENLRIILNIVKSGRLETT